MKKSLFLLFSLLLSVGAMAHTVTWNLQWNGVTPNWEAYDDAEFSLDSDSPNTGSWNKQELVSNVTFIFYVAEGELQSLKVNGVEVTANYSENYLGYYGSAYYYTTTEGPKDYSFEATFGASNGPQGTEENPFEMSPTNKVLTFPAHQVGEAWYTDLWVTFQGKSNGKLHAESDGNFEFYNNGTDKYAAKGNEAPFYLDWTLYEGNYKVRVHGCCEASVNFEFTYPVTVTGAEVDWLATIQGWEGGNGYFEDGSEMVFRPTVPAGKTVKSVKVNNEVVEANDGAYYFTVDGKTEVAVELKAITHVVKVNYDTNVASTYVYDEEEGEEINYSSAAGGYVVNDGATVYLAGVVNDHYGLGQWYLGEEELPTSGTEGNVYNAGCKVNSNLTFTFTAQRVYDDLAAEYTTDGNFESWVGEFRSCKGEATAKATRSEDMTSYTLEFPSVMANISDYNKNYNFGTFKFTGLTPNAAGNFSAENVTVMGNNYYTFTGAVAYNTTTGEATLNGTFKYGTEESYAVQYTVTRAVKAVVDYSLDGKYSVDVRKDAYSFKPTTTTPEGYTGTVKYTSSNTAVLTVSFDGTVTPVAPGNATVTVVAEACDGFKASDAVYFHVNVLEVETRDTQAGKYGTVCLPGVATATGATVMEFVGRNAEGLVFSEVEEMEAGKPYLYVATSDAQEFAYDVTSPAEAQGVNGFWGNLGTEAQQLVAGQYFLSTSDNLFHPAAIAEGETYNTYVYVGVHKCFFTGLPEVSNARGTVTFGVFGDSTTGINGVNLVDLSKDGKVLVNGRLVIVKNNKMYNANGAVVK